MEVAQLFLREFRARHWRGLRTTGEFTPTNTMIFVVMTVSKVVFQSNSIIQCYLMTNISQRYYLYASNNPLIPFRLALR